MVNDARIIQFRELQPQRFPNVVKHDWRRRYPLDEDVRFELEMWLAQGQGGEYHEILKLKCFHIEPMLPSTVYECLEEPLWLDVESIQEWQWEKQAYRFFDAKTKHILFACWRFEAIIITV
jgi:hypothetical protein